MIFFITVLVVGAICAAGGFFWGRYERQEARTNYENLRYEAVAAFRKIEQESDWAFDQLAPWYKHSRHRVNTKEIVKGYPLLNHHLEEIEL